MPPKRSKSTYRKSKRPSKKAGQSNQSSQGTKNQMESHMPPTLLLPFLTLSESADFASTSRRNYRVSRGHVQKGTTKQAVQDGLACYTKFDQLTEGLQTYCQNNAKDALAQMLMMFFGPLSIARTGVSFRATRARFETNNPYGHQAVGRKYISIVIECENTKKVNVKIRVSDNEETNVELISAGAFEITTFLLNNADFQNMNTGKWDAELSLFTNKANISKIVVYTGYFPVNLGPIKQFGFKNYGLKFELTPIVQPPMHLQTSFENVD